MKRKGFLGDYAFYVVFIFVMAISLITIFHAYSQANSSLQSNDAIPDTAKTILSDTRSRFLNTWNWMIGFLILGVFLGVSLLAFTINSHPAFAGIAILSIIVIGGVSIYLANAFNAFATDSTISTTANEFTIIPLIMSRLPFIIIVLGFVFVIILYGKGRSQSII